MNYIGDLVIITPAIKKSMFIYKGNYQCDCIIALSLKYAFLSCGIHFQGSRGGRVVTRLAFQAEDPGSIPGARSHISLIYSSYSSLSIVQMSVPCTPGTTQNQSGYGGISCLSVSDICFSFLFSMYDT